MTNGRILGSAFVDCPVCSCSVPLATINTHLDTGCTVRQDPPRKKQKLIAALTSRHSTTTRLESNAWRSNGQYSTDVRTRAPELSETAAANPSPHIASAEVGQKGLPAATLRTAEGLKDESGNEGHVGWRLLQEHPCELSMGTRQPEANCAPHSGRGTSQKEVAPESNVVSHDKAQEREDVEGGKDSGAEPLQNQWWTARAQRYHQPAALWRKAGSRSTVPLNSQQLQVRS
jgi:hypothetical protein